MYDDVLMSGPTYFTTSLPPKHRDSARPVPDWGSVPFEGIEGTVGWAWSTTGISKSINEIG